MSSYLVITFCIRHASQCPMMTWLMRLPLLHCLWSIGPAIAAANRTEMAANLNNCVCRQRVDAAGISRTCFGRGLHRPHTPSVPQAGLSRQQQCGSSRRRRCWTISATAEPEGALSTPALRVSMPFLLGNTSS